MENPNKSRDKKLCKSITASLGDIVRYSMNETFRNSCFELLNVESTKALQEKIGKTLDAFCNANFKDETPKKQGFTMQDFTPKQDKILPLLEITPKREDKEITKHFMGSGSRNWLNVAAQQTRNTIRRQSLDSIYKPKSSANLRSQIRFNSLADLSQQVTRTPTRCNLSPVPNPQLFSMNSYSCPIDMVSRNNGVERTRKALYFEEDFE